MASQVCIDASLVVQWLVPEQHSEQSLMLLEDWTESQTEMVAPTLLLFEVVAILRFLVVQKVVSEEIGSESVARLTRLPIRYTSRIAIFPLAWSLAQEFRLPTIYDSAYLALARLLKSDFWTADRKFYKAVKAHAPEVRWIGEYQRA